MTDHAADPSHASTHGHTAMIAALTPGGPGGAGVDDMTGVPHIGSDVLGPDPEPLGTEPLGTDRFERLREHAVARWEAPPQVPARGGRHPASRRSFAREAERRYLLTRDGRAHAAAIRPPRRRRPLAEPVAAS